MDSVIMVSSANGVTTEHRIDSTGAITISEMPSSEKSIWDYFYAD